MTDSELIELSKAYVALSNAHRIDLILPMFAAGAIYHSTVTGEFHGRAAIGDMMHQFFANYTDAHWRATGYRCKNREVSFEFSMTASAVAGNSIERRGIEQIDFTADGSIKKIRVEAQ